MIQEMAKMEGKGEQSVAPSIEEIVSIAAQNGLALNATQRGLLASYAALLKQWNQKVNLISRKDEENILTRHILHSLTLAMPSVTEPQIATSARVLDLGTGGGLPGIPLKIARPDLEITLCDSIQKKIAADTSIISALKLTGIRAIVSRAEELSRSEPQRRYEAVLTRAVAPIKDLVEWTQGSLAPGGVIYALKGGDLRAEIAEAQNLKAVAKVTSKPLALVGLEEFVREEKMLVVVHLN